MRNELCVVMTQPEWDEIPHALKGVDVSGRWVWFHDPGSRTFHRMPVFIDATCSAALRDADIVWPCKT